MDERLTRLWAGAEADALGDGGIAIVERATGLSRTTIRAGRDELRAGVSGDDVVAVRRSGGGRPRLEEATPGILAALEALVDPVTPGGPGIAAPVDIEKHAPARDGVGDAGLCGQPAEGRPTAERQRVQSAGHPEDARGHRPSGSQRAVRVHQRSGRHVPGPRRAGCLGRHEEEGAGRHVSERRARMAAQRRSRPRPRARFHGRRAREGDSLRRLRSRTEYGLGQRRD